MRLGLCAQALYHLPLEEALRTAQALGFSCIELPVDRKSPWFDLDDLLAGDWRDLASLLGSHQLEISALSNHQEGQLLLGPHGGDTDPIFEGSPAEKVAYATRRLNATAELARRLDVSVVCGFTGCEDYSRWFPWPVEDGFERMGGAFREGLLPILDNYAALGVRFALECHPRQFAYNLETAVLALDLVGRHEAFGFNFDPANLLLAGIDPIYFLGELGERVLHVHAKDGEVVRHAPGSGLLAHGAWDRPGRGFRFRIPGWGDLPWRRLITELHIQGFDGTMALEHEDPTMGRMEGLSQGVAYLKPLLLHDAPEERWW